jgi:hypothetical protein
MNDPMPLILEMAKELRQCAQRCSLPVEVVDRLDLAREASRYAFLRQQEFDSILERHQVKP